jgi:hypothetical protein
MTDIGKYRQLSIYLLIAMVIGFLLSFASLWNSLLSAQVKHEGWVILFSLLVFSLGLALFFIAYKTTDTARLNIFVNSAVEAGKKEILKEIEEKKRIAEEKRNEEKEIEMAVGRILAGVKAARSVSGICNKLLATMAGELGIVQGIIYVIDQQTETYVVGGEYALTGSKPDGFKQGETLAGEAAVNRTPLIIYDIPEDYFPVASGLGNAKPRYLMLVPVVTNNTSIAVMELALFKKPDETCKRVLDKITAELGQRLQKFTAT